MRIVLLFLALGMVISACKSKSNVPNGILPKDQMQSVLWDIMQAEAYTSERSNDKKDTIINGVAEDARLQEIVFGIHHISRQDFYKSYTYYKEHTDLLIPVLDSITAQENRNENTRLTLRAKAQAKVDAVKVKERADSIKVNALKNKNFSGNQKLLSSKDSIALKSKQKKPKRLKAAHKNNIIPPLR